MNPSFLADLVITEVNSVAALYSPENKRVRRSGRTCWGIAYKYEGETRYVCDGKEFLSDAAHLILLPKGCSYEWHCVSAGHCYMIEFESDAVYDAPVSFPVSNGEKLLKLIRELERKRNLKPAAVHLESVRDVYSVLLLLLQTEQERYLPAEKKQKIAPALEYLSQNYHKKITNDQLASMTGLSTVYFRKLFTYTVGISPIAYAQKLRIEKAKELLKSDYGTLSDLAYVLGYSGLYDFSRAFKKETGIAPSKYANREKG